MIESTAKTKILFVDDSRMVRFAARKCLAGDYDLILAEDGKDALRKLAEHPDVRAVVTDLMMPELDGFGLIEAMRGDESDRVRDLPVLVVSGSAGAAERRRLKAFGVGDMMTKPFRDDALKLRVERLIGAEEAEVEAAVAEVAAPRSQARKMAPPLPENVETNRASFVGRLRQALALHVRHKLPLSILQIRLANAEDLDRDFGEGGARAAMRLVEHLILKTVRVEDTVGRTGPTQRTLLLPATSVEGARALRGRLRDAVAAHQCTIGGKRPDIELDFLVHTPKPNLDAASLMKETRPGKLLDNVVSLPARATG
jgi:PleD family two-component response regulator